MISAKDTVADIVLQHSECAPVFQKHRIDFCCRGHLRLEEAAKARNLDAEALVAELEDAVKSRLGQQVATDFREMRTPTLIAHIIASHHEYLRRALPFLVPLAAKVARVHGGENPRLRDLDVVVRELHDALLPHLDREEDTLFPALMSKEPDPVLVQRELAEMMADHLEVAELIERMRNATEDYRLPAHACNSYRTLFAELEKMESDILRHVHLENHVLMPRFSA